MEIVQLHYYLEDNSHSMDAAIKNSAEAEIIKIFKEVAKILDAEIDLEVAALEPGGIKEVFKILKRKKVKKAVKPILGYLGPIIASVIAALVANSLTKNEKLEELEIMRNELEIKKLSKELGENNISEIDISGIVGDIVLLISNTGKIRTYKSNFYSLVSNEDRVTKIGTSVLDDQHREIGQEQIILRADFKKFIVDEIAVAPLTYHGINVEIVSPVLKSGRMKWKGVFDSKPINFHLNDSEFRQLVLNREVSFTSGSVIKCDIEFERKIDQNGEIIVTAVNVSNVSELFQGELQIVTTKGKRKHSRGTQLGLFE